MKKYLTYLLALLAVLGSRAAHAQTFGLTGYTKEFWLKADNPKGNNTLYDNGQNISTGTTWADLSGQSNRSFTRAPGGIDDRVKFTYNGFNFHPAFLWNPIGDADIVRLACASALTQSASQSYYVFIVSKPSRHNVYLRALLTLHPYNEITPARSSISWGIGPNENKDKDLIHIGYLYNGTTGSKDYNFTPAQSDKPYGIIGVDIPNNGNTTVYLNGRSITAFHTNYRWATTSAETPYIGNIGDTYLPYSGTIQEILMLSKAGNAAMPAADVKKIQSYLAVKYGITLLLQNSSDNYVNSSNQSIWNYDSHYNANIFGLGRDDASGLCQKQSQSVDNPTLKIFVGNQMKDLNKENSGSLSNGQYLMLGYNGQTGFPSIQIPKNTPYENGPLNTDLTFQSAAIYKAQVTGTNSFTVNLQVGIGYSYALVSSSEQFLPATTRIYPVNVLGTVTASINNTYRYIRFAGYSTGPGGINAGLKLWLRADDSNMLTIENVEKNDATVVTFPTAEANLYPGSSLPAVVQWTDYLRNKDYTFANAATGIYSSYARKPVYKESSPEMNFHPAVRFYSQQLSGFTVPGSYLRCNTGLLAYPNSAKHTAIFVTNNDFATNPWVYPMGFGAQMGDYNGPQYGVEKTADASKIFGRVRLNARNATDDVVSGTQDLFKIGATSILHYDLNHDINTKKGVITFRFNGKEDQVSYGPLSSADKGGLQNTFNMDTYSILGGGYMTNRVVNGVMAEAIIFEGNLSPADITKVNSYLAFKYGITIRTNIGTERYDYVINNGQTMVWNGTQSSGKFVTYYNNVAAIVRDDVSQLNNHQSHSTDQGSILHLGVAGTQLGGQLHDIGELQDREAVAFGHDNASGINDAVTSCGKFTKIFKRHWFIHKVTNGNRPVSVLVGAEDNRNNNLGKDASDADKAYYAQLGNPRNRFFLLVASDPAELNDYNNGNFKVVPMYYINGEQQCIYTFTEKDTYVTFAYTPDEYGATPCTATVDFKGTKTFKWLSTPQQWGYPVHKKSGTASAGQTFTKPAVALDHNISVVAQVAYDANVQAPYGFPSAVLIPKDALEIRRTHGTVDVSKVTVTIHFQTSDKGVAEPVIPSFSISDLDAQGLNQRDEVTITGYCGNKEVLPKLTPAGTKPSFSINGNRARVDKTQEKSAADKNGTVNVAFQSGVSQIVIVYKLTNAENALPQNIVISPISFTPGEKPVLLPPFINEDGISFHKQAKEKTLTSCEEVEYLFHIQNTTKTDKYFKLNDVLPSGMTWKPGSLGLDELNIDSNKKLHIGNYEGSKTLAIDSILVKCAGNIKISATALMNESAASGDYSNRASLSYEHLKTNGIQTVPVDTTVNSTDYETHEENTVVNITAATRSQPVTVVRAETSPTKYSANSEVTVTLEVHNPNAAVSDMYANINWGSNFNYVPGSLTVTSSSTITFANVQPNPPYAAGEIIESLLIAGNANGESGFILPSGNTVIRFKVKAPDQAHLDFVDDTKTEIHPLLVVWDFFINTSDACKHYTVNNLEGEIEAPYYLDVYIDDIIDNFGPNTGGTYTRNSNETNGIPVHWGTNSNGTIRIYGGEHFASASTIVVKFGGVPATHVTIVSDNILSCVPPAATAATVWNDKTVVHTYSPIWGYEGRVDIEMEIQPTITGKIKVQDAYAYRAPMTITGISPAWGNTRGGDEVIIEGHNFFLPNGTKPAIIKVAFAASDNDPAPAVATVDLNASTNNSITVINAPHKVNHTYVTVDNTWEQTPYASFTYVPTVFIENGKWTEFTKWEDHSDENILPYPQSVIHIKANCVQDISVDMDSITVYPSKGYTVDAGKTVKANVFTLLDNASFLNYGTDHIVKARALHTLAKGRNWYISSPMQNGTIPTIEDALGKDKQGNALSNWRVERYDEPVHQWKAAGGAFSNSMGYTAYAGNDAIAVEFTGRFTDGNKTSPALTRQNDAHPKRGFNLVGNPFPSYWRWTSTSAQAANLYSTIWYRTNVDGTSDGYRFWSYNAAGNVAVAPGWEDEVHGAPYSLAYIPPMQAFWVRIRDGQSSGTLTFANDRRTHADHNSNILKVATAPETRPLVRITAFNTNDKRTDETLIYADAAATNGFDDYDGDKWFMNQGTEIFTLPMASNCELAINGLPRISAGTEISLGFQAQEGGIFSIRATEIRNCDTLDVVLRDKWTKKDFNLRSPDSYYFSSGNTTNSERFSIVFRRSSSTGLPDAENNDRFLAYTGRAGQIVVELYISNLKNSTVNVSVFDVAGRLLTEQPVVVGERTTLKGTFKDGVYLLRADRWSAKATVSNQ